MLFFGKSSVITCAISNGFPIADISSVSFFNFSIRFLIIFKKFFTPARSCFRTYKNLCQVRRFFTCGSCLSLAKLLNIPVFVRTKIHIQLAALFTCGSCLSLAKRFNIPVFVRTENHIQLAALFTCGSCLPSAKRFNIPVFVRTKIYIQLAAFFFSYFRQRPVTVGI